MRKTRWYNKVTSLVHSSLNNLLLGIFVVALEARVECMEQLIAQLKQQHKDYIVNLIREQEVTMKDFSLNLENTHLDEVLEGILGFVCWKDALVLQTITFNVLLIF